MKRRSVPDWLVLVLYVIPGVCTAPLFIEGLMVRLRHSASGVYLPGQVLGIVSLAVGVVGVVLFLVPVFGARDGVSRGRDRLRAAGRRVLVAALLVLIVALGIQIWLRAGIAIKGRDMALAESEIRNADMALAKMLADAEKKSLFGFFNDVEAAINAYGGHAAFWNMAVSELLRNGRNARLDLKPEVRRKLGSTYQNIGNDPWGHPYQFFAGQLTVENYGNADVMYYFRSFRRPERASYTDRNGMRREDYYYDSEAMQAETGRIRRQYEESRSQGGSRSGGRYADGSSPEHEGQYFEVDAVVQPEAPPEVPRADGLPGYPAMTDLHVYIWSLGRDGRTCQRVGKDLSPENVTAGPSQTNGDDINNWDNAAGWESFHDWQ